MILAENKTAHATISFDKNDEDGKAVAKELQRCLKIATGAKFSAKSSKLKDDQPRIVIQKDPSLLKRYQKRTCPAREAIRWTCDGKKHLTISGNDSNALWCSLYAFLEQKLNCRWFFPGEAGEDIPAHATLRVGKFDTQYTPSYITRDLYFWPEQFQRKKLGGGPRMSGIHSYSDIIPEKMYKKHPEYAVMIDGKRQTVGGYQRCVSQKGVEDATVEYCLDYFKKNPDKLIVGVSPNDGENFCDCPKCVKTNLGRKPKKGERSPFWVTRSIFEFSNRVAERVSKVYPDKLILTIAYSRTKEPMDGLKLHPNVLVDYCSQPHFNWQGKQGIPRLEREIRAWTKVADHIGIFDYILNQSWPGLVRPLTGILDHELKYFHRHGVRYYYSQHGTDFGVNLPNYYLMCALCWDINQDKEKVLNDMYRRCFRKAGSSVKKYFELMEAAIMDKAATGPGPGTIDITCHRNGHENVAAIFTEEVMETAKALLDKAAKQVADDDVASQRLTLIRKGFDYLSVTVDATRITCEYVEKYRIKSFTPWAWNVGNYDYHNTIEKMEMFGKPCVEEFQAVMAAWERYREMRFPLEEENVLTPHFSRGGFSFDPKMTLDNIWGLYTGTIKEVPPLVSAKRVLRAM